MKCIKCGNEMDSYILSNRGRCNHCGFDVEEMAALLPDLLAALEAVTNEANKMQELLVEITPSLYITEVQDYLPYGLMDKVRAWVKSTAPGKAIEQARAALAAAEAK